MGANVPTLPRVRVGIIEINRDGVGWGGIGITGREEKYSPEWVFRLRGE